MRKTALGCTILEGHDIADLPLISENSEILEREIKRIEQEGGKVKSVNGKTGEVVLKGEDIKLNSGKNVEEKIDNLDSITGGTTASNENIVSQSTAFSRQTNVSLNSTINASRSQINASIDCTTLGDFSQVNTSTANSTAEGKNSQLNSTERCTAKGRHSQINASSHRCSTEGTCSQINASSDECIATGNWSQINTSINCTTKSNYSQINACGSDNLTDNNYTQINASASGNRVQGAYSQINASTGCRTTGSYSQINSSQSSTAYSRSTILSSAGSEALGTHTAIMTSNRCKVDSIAGTNIYSTIISSADSTIGKSSTSNLVAFNLIASSANSINTGYGSTILSSSTIVNPERRTVAGGYSVTGSASSKNRKCELHSENGTIKASGSITQNSTFTDYAEYFESVDGKAIPTGEIVTLEGDKIRVANEGEEMLGVISETAGVILGASGFYWQDRYSKNEFGGLIYEAIKDYKAFTPPVELKEILDGEGNIIGHEEIELPYSEEDIPLITVPKENPEHNMNEEYIPREDRAEWNIVGLVGQVYIRCDDTLKPGDYIKVGEDGMATKDDNPTYQRWRVMKITTPYSEEKGYGVALVFIR